MVHDLTEKTQAARLLHERALTDELTGLPNRAAWNAEVQRGVARAHRAGVPATVMFMDLGKQRGDGESGAKVRNHPRPHPVPQGQV